MRFLQALAEIRKRSTKPEHHHHFRLTSRKCATLSAGDALVQPQKQSEGKYGGGSLGGGGSADENCVLRQLTSMFPSGGDDPGHGLASNIVSTGRKIIGALNRGDREKAFSLLGDESLRLGDFVDVLRHCADSPDPLLAMQTWRIMEEKGIIPDRFCYRCVIQALCEGGYLEEAFNLLKYPGEGYTSYSSAAAYNIFLKYTWDKDSPEYINQCLELIELMDQRKLAKSQVTYAYLLKIAVSLKNLSVVNQIWEEYIKHFSPCIVSLKNFVAAFARLGDLNSAHQKLQQMVDLAFLNDVTVDNTSGYPHVGSSKLGIPVPVISPSHVENFDREDDGKDPFQLETSGPSSSAVGELGKKIQCGKSRPIKVGNPTCMLLRWSFRDVIYICAESKNLELAEKLKRQMEYLRVRPTKYVYHPYVKAVVRGNGIDEAMKVLKEMQQQNIKPHNSTLAELSMACSDALDLDSAEDLLNQMSSSRDPYPFNHFFAACDQLAQPRRAIHMLNKMRQLGVRPDVRTFEMLFSLFATDVNGLDEAGSLRSRADCMKRINALEMDMAKNNVQHNHWSLMHLLKALAVEGMLREFVRYLRLAEDTFHCIECDSQRTRVYTTIIHSLIEANNSNHDDRPVLGFCLEQYNLAIELFKMMRANGVQPALDTYCIMIDGCTLIRSYECAQAVASLMLRDGYLVNDVVYSALVKVALKCGNLSEGLRLLDEMTSDKMQNIVVYNDLIRKAVNKGMFDLVEILVEQMHRYNIKPDSGTYSLVCASYMKQRRFSEAVEAVLVLSQRRIYLEKFSAEEVESYALMEDSDAEGPQDSDAEIQVLEELFAIPEDVAFPLLNLRWCSMIGLSIACPPNQSIWAQKTSIAYDTWLTSTNGSWSKWLNRKKSRP